MQKKLKLKVKNKFKAIKNKITLKKVYCFGIFMIVIGVILFSSDYIYMKFLQIYDEMNYKIFLNTEANIAKDDGSDDENLDSSQIKNNEKEKKSFGVYNYVAMLEIPKIELKRGLVAKGSYANRVSQNIQTLKESSYPNVDNGNLILAAHSGNGYNAFFKNLHKLKTNDLVNVYYDDVKYTYQIKDIYLQDKVGKIIIYRDRSETTLTLITCSNSNRKKQTIYVAELESYVTY